MIDPARAWEPFEPTGTDPWDRARVAHLHRRAGFAPAWETIDRDLKDGPKASVGRLLDGEATSGDGLPAAEFAVLMDAMAARLGPSGGLPQLQGTWLYRMIFTPHPLQERMTLFWHDHFATSNAKVNNNGLMRRQNATIRSHALGDFGELLGAMAHDPAMLIWLDATANRKARPNENFAREVMELFTLGRGRYTERDVREVARAFSGAFIVDDQYREIPSQHDDGTKTILGQSGAFRGEDVERILLEQPACAEFICGKLYRHFVSEVDPPTSALIAPLARAFRESGHAIRVPLELIFRSRFFHDPSLRRRRVKGPVEFAVGMIRALEVLSPTARADALAEACGRMGQNLYAPPSVAGWDDGPSWINTTAMLARTNLALAILSDDDAAFGKRLDPEAVASRHVGSNRADVASFLIDLLVQDAFEPKVREHVIAAGDPRTVATLVLTSPEFQLA